MYPEVPTEPGFSNHGQWVVQHACQQQASLSQDTGLPSCGCLFPRVSASKYQQRNSMGPVEAEQEEGGSLALVGKPRHVEGMRREAAERNCHNNSLENAHEQIHSFSKHVPFSTKRNPELLLGAKTVQNKLGMSCCARKQGSDQRMMGTCHKDTARPHGLLLATRGTIWTSK